MDRKLPRWIESCKDRYEVYKDKKMLLSKKVTNGKKLPRWIEGY